MIFSKLFKKKKKDEKIDNTDYSIPYDKREKVSPLSLVITIVNRNQANFFVTNYQEAGASMSMVLYAYSMPPEEFRNVLGKDNSKKEMILTICRSEDVPKLKAIAKERFSISDLSKGIMTVSPIDAVSSVSVYKYLADTAREQRGEKNNGNQE